MAKKNTKVKLDLLTNINILLMVQKGIWGDICHAMHEYAEANNKYMKVFDRNEESSYLKYWVVSNLYRWSMLQKLPVNCFKWFENTFQFIVDFIKCYNEGSVEEYFFEVYVQYPEKVCDLHNDLPFIPEIMKIENIEKFVYINNLYIYICI